jgi:ABC-type cobalamin/Fe3+-siderophores transport system ATPase subunit
MNQSSKWNIWDFHLHTPFSILNNNFGNPEDEKTWTDYVEKVTAKAKEKGVVALGVTDYFTIEGYKKLLALQEKGDLEGILLFPNIEFRIDKIIYSTKRENGAGKKINLHVLFSPDIPPKEIEEGFLHDLDFCYYQNPFEPSNIRKLKRENLISFGSSLREQEPSFHDKSDILIGCNNVIVKSEQIKERLDSRFRGSYLLVLADEDLSEMSWEGGDHAARKQLVQMSHAIFSSNSRTREFCLGYNSSPEEFVKEFKSLKPCIWGCDSHGYEKKERFLEPQHERYCWIKSKVTWEGLKQVLYEPDERVKVQTNNPEDQKSSFTLTDLKIEKTKLNESLSIDDFSIELNPNLVTIIGGRGSGKTALLDMIASCFPEGAKLHNIKESFIHRLYTKEGKIKPSTSPINLSLVFQSGESYEGKIGSDQFQYFEKSDILYLTQNHFQEYSADPKKLNSHIRELVFDTFPDYKYEYENLQQSIKKNEQDIQHSNLKMQQLEQEVSEKENELVNQLKLKKGSKDDITHRICSMEEQQGQSHTEVSNLTDKLEELKRKKRQIEETLGLFQQFENEIKSFNLSYENYVEKINDQITLFGDSDKLNKLPLELLDLKEVENTLIKNGQFLNGSKDVIGSQIVEQNQNISVLEGAGKTIAELRQKLANFNTEIQEIENEIQEVENIKKHIEELRLKRLSLYAETIKTMCSLKIFFQKIIDEFEDGKDQILSNLKFSAFVDMQKKSEYIQQIADKINNSIHSQEVLSQNFASIFDEMEELMNSDNHLSEADSGNEHYISIVRKIEEQTKDLRLKKAVTKSDYFNTVFRFFFDLSIEISFNNKPIDSLSMGERAIVLLKILLSLDDKPLLIDQPEEHLDNRFIFNELVPAFRNAKTKRQIIIATHNANLVVNTNAEQIIVAEPSGGKIKYSCGAIEDLEIREKITQLLEGGELAFKKREEKYGYKF